MRAGQLIGLDAHDGRRPDPRCPVQPMPRRYRMSRNRLDFDLRTERKGAGLEREPRWRGRNVGELPAPPGIEVSVVVDVAEHTLHVHDVVD